ncbi:hypothetical protein B0J11DRAFT_542786 [Dendryphion nanum]|uniref:Fungal N-terminal domain-containing protein n=1 Tax=Dendryphion nanum TaxID=256645 RepID=A0A9P9D4A0_9PLEO|nr:hypothetical protein B0J11DRAFT_542786 [Dendryphion nanum]
MDPLTITSTVIALSARCVRSARGLYELRAKYKDASMTITAIYTESNVIATSLACIQGLCTTNPDALRSTLQTRPEITETFDQALTGCILVYSVLEDEVHRLYSGIHQVGFGGTMGRLRLLWKEEAMQEVLTQIRGQQTALSLLINILQLNSIHEVHTLLQEHVETFESTAQRL